MDDHVAVAGTNHRQAINARGQMREKIRYLDPALAILTEGPPGAEQLRAAFDELIFGFAELFGPGLPVKFVEQWLGIECLQMTRSARHEKKNHCLGLRRLMRGPRIQWIDRPGARVLAKQDGCQGERAKSAKSIAHEFAARASHSQVFGPVTGHRERH